MSVVLYAAPRLMVEDAIQTQPMTSEWWTVVTFNE
jgi:hypothetical protein